MGYWLVIREIMGVRDCEGVFKSKPHAEAYARKEGYSRYDVEYRPVDGDKTDDDRIFLASTYVASEDLFEFFGLYSSYSDAKNALHNRFGQQKKLILGLVPV